MFDQFSAERPTGTRRRLFASYLGAAVFYAAGFSLLAVLFAGVEAVALPEPEVELKFFKAPPPPPPPPPPPVALPAEAKAAPPPAPPPRSRPPTPQDASLPPPRPIEAPQTPPSVAPADADPSLETGPPPGEPGGGADPFGQRGGRPDGKPGGRPGGEPGGTGDAVGPSAIILPAGAQRPEPVEPSIKPEYPEIARAAKFEGEVMVKVIVHLDGHLEVVRVLKSDPNFDAVVIEFLKTVRYRPAMYDGKPIAVFQNLRFPFRLH